MPRKNRTDTPPITESDPPELHTDDLQPADLMAEPDGAGPSEPAVIDLPEIKEPHTVQLPSVPGIEALRFVASERQTEVEYVAAGKIVDLCVVEVAPWRVLDVITNVADLTDRILIGGDPEAARILVAHAREKLPGVKVERC